jgi:hypothetical protein
MAGASLSLLFDIRWLDRRRRGDLAASLPDAGRNGLLALLSEASRPAVPEPRDAAAIRRLLSRWEDFGDHEEDQVRCVTRERHVEIEAAIVLGLPVAVTVDGKDAVFLHGGAEDFAGTLCLFRTEAAPGRVAGLAALAASLGAAPLCTEADDAMVADCLDGLPGSFTRRRVRRDTLSSFLTPDDEFFIPERHRALAGADGRIFMKTVRKKASVAVNLDPPHFGSDEEMMEWSMSMNPRIPVYVQQFVEIARDGHGTLEWRGFMVDGEPACISRYVDYESLPVPGSVDGYMRAFGEAARDLLPAAYVVDVALDAGGSPFVVEVNGAVASGRYEDNDVASWFLACGRHAAERLAAGAPAGPGA